jgi:cell division protein FtsW (lipid II flippase)
LIEVPSAKDVVSVLGLINTLLLFAVALVGAYQQTMFVQEWLEDHAKSEGFLRRQMLSVTALFSNSVTERCRNRRRQVSVWTYAFFVLLAVQLLLAWL